MVHCCCCVLRLDTEKLSATSIQYRQTVCLTAVILYIVMGDLNISILEIFAIYKNLMSKIHILNTRNRFVKDL